MVMVVVALRVETVGQEMSINTLEQFEDQQDLDNENPTESCEQKELTAIEPTEEEDDTNNIKDPGPVFQIGEETMEEINTFSVVEDESSNNSLGTVPASLCAEDIEKMSNTEMNIADVSIDESPVATETAEPDLISLTPSEGGDSSSTKSKVKPPNNRAPEVMHVTIQPSDIVEYEWPQKSGDRFFVQEQISELLGINSFKRKYSEMSRRTVEPKERDYLLKDLKINIALPAHHLTALLSADVHELMVSEYPEIYAEYQKACNERLKQAMLEKQKELDAIKMDAKKMAELRQKAIKSACEFNAELQAVRKIERVQYWDLNTNIIHSPLNKWMRMASEYTKPSKYPVFCLPGQYTDYYKKFTPDELRKMPLNTVLDREGLFPPKKEQSPPAVVVSEEEVAAAAAKIASENAAKLAQSAVKEEISSAPPTPETNNVEGAPAKKPIKQEPQMPFTPKTAVTQNDAMAPPPSKLRKMSASTSSTGLNNNGNTTNKRNKNSSALSSKVSNLSPKSASTAPSMQKNQQQPAMAICSICQLVDPNPNAKSQLIRCSACQQQMHSSCIDMPLSMVEVIRQYDWLCIDCKRCCVCEQPDQEAAMMCCDQCDRGYHTFCIGLDQPPNGTWHCPECKGEVSASIGTKKYLNVKPTSQEKRYLKVEPMELEKEEHKAPIQRKRGRPKKYPVVMMMDTQKELE